MKYKLFEIRDKGTFIPALFIKMEQNDPHEYTRHKYLYERSGLIGEGSYSSILFHLNVGEGRFDWSFSRTMGVAHEYIEKNFDTLEPGEVIDVEFILGESSHPKLSEEYTHPTT